MHKMIIFHSIRPQHDEGMKVVLYPWTVIILPFRFLNYKGSRIKIILLKSCLKCINLGTPSARPSITKSTPKQAALSSTPMMIYIPNQINFLKLLE